jgi:hypothetical protein
MFKRIFTLVLLLTGIGSYVYGQAYSGPAQGTIPSGATVSTDNYSRNLSIVEPTNHVWNEESEYEDQANYMNFRFPSPKEGSNYFEDPSLHGGRQEMDSPILLKDFPGIPQGNSIPPDPHCAVGPDHFMAVVNTSFRIYDKDGNVLKTIAADSWFTNVFPSAGAFDPKVLYDMIDQRWVMVWLQQNDGAQTATILLSVSDDSDPLGTWYNWAIPANQVGGTVVSNWSDYQGVGYDENALYITSSQFSFTGYYQYTKIRIIGKAQLYANTAGSVTWSDLWNIGLPPGASGSPFHIRPAYMYTSASQFYLAYTPNGGNFVSLYKITDPLGTPALTGVNIPVTSYSSAPNADQLGGSTMLIETGGSNLQNEPKYRDGFLYVVHSVRNPTASTYSSIHYMKINVSTNTADMDFVFGETGYWHFYPAVEVDQDGNVAVTYSRSGDTEYIGAYFTTRLAGDPAGFSGSVPLKLGEANYVKDFGGGRNRWGDYMGIQLDPVDQNNFWLFTEYAKSPQNTWATWVGEIRAQPFTGAHIYSRTNKLNLGNIEINNSSDPKEVKLFNFGSDDLVITDIPATIGPFQTVNVPSGSITIAPYDSLVFDVVFSPVTQGIYNLTLNVTSNDPGFAGIELDGNGYKINQVVQGKMYASSGIHSNGVLFDVNLLTGQADSIGTSQYDDVDYISTVTINPETNIMYGLFTQTDSSYLLRVNPLAGDAYKLYTLDLANLQGIAFDTTATLYAVKKSGEIYTVDLTDGSYTQVASTGVSIASIAFDPTNNDLYASALVIVGANKDRLYKIDLSAGTADVVGNTGFGVVTNAIEFDNLGNLYGTKGSATTPNDFFQIDKSTAVGTVIGSLNAQEITGLAFARSGVTGVKDPGNSSNLPTDYSLKQNYPNPFNPSTRIEYTLPVSAGVKVVIYNLLGEIVNVLVDRQQNAGSHTVTWNSEDIHGNKVGSGVYFYELKANGSNGSGFTQIRKMILLK